MRSTDFVFWRCTRDLCNCTGGLGHTSAAGRALAVVTKNDGLPPAEAETVTTLYAALPAEIRKLCSSDWSSLAGQVRQEDQNTCLQIARQTYLTRHLAAQHACVSKVLAALPSWLQARRPTVCSPCRWCHQDFKAQHSSRARHTQACTTLVRTGIYLLLHRASQEPSLCDGNGADGGKPSGADVGQGAGESPAGPSGSAATTAPAPSGGENKRGQEWETG